MALQTTNPWGKIIGGALGLSLAGPWGLAVGAIIGHMYDKQRGRERDGWAEAWGNTRDFSPNAGQAAFTMGVVVLGAKMAKSDGRVTRAEIDAFKRVFHISPAQEAAVGRLFDRARESAEGFEPYAFQLAQVFRRNPAVLEEILGGLFIIGAADYAGLSQAEMTFLKRVAFIFGFGVEDFARIAASSGVKLPEKERSHQSVTNEAYAILGVKDTDAPEKIKKAYRDLIRKHHPDTLIAQGMAPEFVATATEKMKRINVAYDTVCKLRGIK